MSTPEEHIRSAFDNPTSMGTMPVYQSSIERDQNPKEVYKQLSALKDKGANLQELNAWLESPSNGLLYDALFKKSKGFTPNTATNIQLLVKKVLLDHQLDFHQYPQPCNIWTNVPETRVDSCRSGAVVACEMINNAINALRYGFGDEILEEGLLRFFNASFELTDRLEKKFVNLLQAFKSEGAQTIMICMGTEAAAKAQDNGRTIGYINWHGDRSTLGENLAQSFRCVFVTDHAFERDKRASKPFVNLAATILHECTHIFLETKDEEISKKRAYGFNLCSKLANDNKEKALNNADSLALFAQWLYESKIFESGEAQDYLYESFDSLDSSTKSKPNTSDGKPYEQSQENPDNW